MIIFKGVMHQSTWYENTTLPSNWVIGVSENGWTNDKLGLTWVKDIFNPYTQGRTIRKYRLLVLDGHGSYVTPEFDRFCSENSIIVLCMPPHSSHLLQPLDVSCFALLKKAYGSIIQRSISLGINYIDKQDFLLAYQQARNKALTENNIRNEFAATEIVPYNSERVLMHLQVQIRTPSPLLAAANTSVHWTPEIPHNITELQQQAEAIKGFLKNGTQISSSLTNRALNQLIKGCQMAMHSVAILASENAELHAENQQQKWKRGKRLSYIAKGGVLTVAEGMHRVQDHQTEGHQAESHQAQVVESP
jgi:DDE superfamily endonuclease